MSILNFLIKSKISFKLGENKPQLSIIIQELIQREIMRLLLLLFLTLNLLNAQKLALLIGNSQYTHLDILSSPSKDIPALATKLRAMNFEVVDLYDLDEKAMKQAIKDFKKRLQKHPDAIALFYYSGHGSQADGESYLIPIDGDTRDEADVEADGVKVETIAQKMAHARTKANILFLDACRDVPTGTMGNGTKGLGQVKHRPSGSLIVYSTSKNTTAKDDRLFNKVVLEKLATNVPLTTLANDISYSVDQKTEGKQVPEVFVKSLPNLCLSGSCNQPQEPKVLEKIVYRDRVMESKPKPIKIQKEEKIENNNLVKSSKNIITINGLMYQNRPIKAIFTEDTDPSKNWYEAKDYCRQLDLNGYKNWRLPRIDELAKLSTVPLFQGRYSFSSSEYTAWEKKYKKKRIKNSKGRYSYMRKEFSENLPRNSTLVFWTSEQKNISSAYALHFGLAKVPTLSKKHNEEYVICVK